jgi:hypothetical protein
MRHALVASLALLAAMTSTAAARAQQPAAPPPAPSPATAPVAPPAPTTPPPATVGEPAVLSSPAVQITTLRDLRDRGVISEAEYDAAMRDIGPSTGEEKAGEATSLALGRWTTTFYGFVEGDFIYDTTQGLNDSAGNAQIARPNGQAPAQQPNYPNTQQTYAGSNGQMQFSVRNSRFGIRLKPPGNESIRSSGMLEFDFLGNQSLGYGAGQVSESAFFSSPLLRIRHAMLRLETPVVDLLVGQYWDLFGWQGVYHPNTVEIQGLPGELYARDVQLRISKTLHADPVTLEIAVAAVRPPSRGSAMPDFQGGLRVAVDSWTGMQTQGATATAIAPASIALTGDYRTFAVPALDSLTPTKTVTTTATSVAADAFLPVLPAKKDKRDNALSLNGEIVYGAGISNMYTGLNGGVMFPAVPNLAGLNPAPSWPQNIDNGMVDYDINPGGFALHPIQWTTYLVGLQYYLPALKGKVWISANYSHTQSRDGSLFGQKYSATSDFAVVGQGQPNGSGVNAPTATTNYYFQSNTGEVRAGEDWWDVNLFYDPVPSVRVGAEIAEFLDHYVDGFTASDVRGQVSGFFLF